MRVFLTGGSGFIGGHVVKRIAEAGHACVCLVRSEPSSDAPGCGIQYVRGDLLDRRALREGMAGCDCVIHLAAAYSFWRADRREYRRVNVDGTRCVMECALDGDVSKVLHASTLATYGHRDERPVTEETPVGPVRFSEYARSKYEGERIAWALREERGLPLVVLYPGGVLGPFDPKPTGEYIQALIRGRMPVRVLENAVFPFVHVADVAEAIVRAAERNDNLGAKYFLVAENLTFGQINRMVQEVSKAPLPTLRLPASLVVATAAFLTLVADIVKKPPAWGMATDQVATMRTDTIFSGAKAERELGFRYTPIRRAIEESVASCMPGSRLPGP